MSQAINSELKKNNIDKKCVTLITQVEVSKDDAAFKNPTKPVGMFYTKEESEKIATEKITNFLRMLVVVIGELFLLLYQKALSSWTL